MMTLKTPVISVLIGEGGSGGALALSVADKVYMLENSVYSVISPEGCASILWKDSTKAPDAARCLKLTAQDALELGIIEDIISEENMEQPDFFSGIKEMLLEDIYELNQIPTEYMLENRYQRFRAIGRTE